MFKIVDKRCTKCGEIMTDVVDSKENKCNICGGKLKRLYGFKKYKEYPEGFYEHFEESDGKPVYIKDREHFWKECKKRGIEPIGDKVAKKVKARKRMMLFT